MFFLSVELDVCICVSIPLMSLMQLMQRGFLHWALYDHTHLRSSTKTKLKLKGNTVPSKQQMFPIKRCVSSSNPPPSLIFCRGFLAQNLHHFSHLTSDEILKIRLTSWYGKYPIIYRVLYILGGAGFLPSSVLEWNCTNLIWWSSINACDLWWFVDVGSVFDAQMSPTNMATPNPLGALCNSSQWHWHPYLK